MCEGVGGDIGMDVLDKNNRDEAAQRRDGKGEGVGMGKKAREHQDHKPKLTTNSS